jgi:hypothetical protein
VLNFRMIHAAGVPEAALILVRRHGEGRRRQSESLSARFVLGLVMPLSLAILGCLGLTWAPPAHACVPGEDVNILCANEQQLVNELAAAGLTPAQGPRQTLGLTWKICGDLWNGEPYDVAVQKVYRDNRINLAQAQAIVAATVRNLCPYTAR